jgi:hypothetical protein
LAVFDVPVKKESTQEKRERPGQIDEKKTGLTPKIQGLAVAPPKKGGGKTAKTIMGGH